MHIHSEYPHFIFNKSPIYTNDDASAKFNFDCPFKRLESTLWEEFEKFPRKMRGVSVGFQDSERDENRLTTLYFHRRKIRLIEDNARCHHLQNWPTKGLCGRCFMSEAQNSTPPPHKHCIVYSVYVYTIYLFTQGGGGVGAELNQREGERGNSSQSWVENTNVTDCISSLHSTYTLINTCCNVPLQMNFLRWRQFALVSMQLISPWLSLSKIYSQKRTINLIRFPKIIIGFNMICFSLGRPQ